LETRQLSVADCVSGVNASELASGGNRVDRIAENWRMVDNGRNPLEREVKVEQGNSDGEIYEKLNRRSLLRQAPALAGSGRVAAGLARAQGQGRQPERKLRVVAVGGHFDDPQTCAGGTLTLYADQGHDVVGLSLTGGPPPPPNANPEERSVKNRLNAMRMAEILKIRLDCLNYSGSNSGQFRLPIVYGSGCEVTGQRYKEFTEILLDKYKPDIVFTHWPIDFHMDHRAASMLTYSAWLASGKKFPLYYMEAELGMQTQNFYPTHYVDITSVEERTHQAWLATLCVVQGRLALHDLMRRMRGRERGQRWPKHSITTLQSPTLPALP
jgi:LmbE family N-acetylglucosaminyl deacetylase